MLKIVICIEQEELRNKYTEWIMQIKEAQNLLAEIEVFEKGKQLLFEQLGGREPADLIFLETEEIDEIKVAQDIRKNQVDAKIVLLVKDEEKALEAFDVNALHCIALNSMDEEAQHQIVNKVLHKIEGRIYQHIILKNREGKCKVLLRDIQYFEVINHKITMHYQRRTKPVQEFEFCGSIGRIGHALCKKGFIYPNRSYVVSKNYVKQLSKGKLILMNDLEVGIGRTKMQEVKKVMQEIF